MKKNLYLLLILFLLFTTGCSCQYNLIIENDIYKEEIKLIGENNDEINSFNNDWKISIDKEEFNHPGDPESEPSITKGTYTYKLSGNTLTFTNDFTIDNYPNSSAVSACYRQLTVEKYNDSIIISSSPEIDCFNRYPPLNELTVNITVDTQVISNNADSVNNNTYTWNLTRNNNKKAINIVLKNENNIINIPTNNGNTISNNNIKPSNNISDYTLYIVLAIILVLFLLGYLIFNIIKNKEDVMDD